MLNYLKKQIAMGKLTKEQVIKKYPQYADKL